MKRIAIMIIAALLCGGCSLLIDVGALTEGRDSGRDASIGQDAAPDDAAIADSGTDGGIDPCRDGIANGDETAVDCGGSCATCPLFAFCAEHTDCESGYCPDGSCRLRCDDFEKNGDETDIDCGGSCEPCGYGYACENNTDCASTLCWPQEKVCICNYGGDPGPIGMIPIVAQNRVYCINYVEVTRGAYALFLEHLARQTSDPRTVMRRSCRELLAPPHVTAGKELEPLLFVTPSPETAGLPIAYVSFCQAKTYCEFYGFRLCGALDYRPLRDGFTGPPNGGQWYRACSEDNIRDYPYVRGSTTTEYNAAACNGLDAGYFTALYASSLATCEGGAQYLYDMSGNVMEWEDECEGGYCRLRGGSYLSEADYLRCSSELLVEPEFQANEIGFRCCSAAPAY